MAFIYTWYACIKWGVVQRFLSDCTVMMILLISNWIVDTPPHNTHLPTSNIIIIILSTHWLSNIMIVEMIHSTCTCTKKDSINNNGGHSDTYLTLCIGPRWLKIMKLGLLLTVSNVLESSSVVSLMSLNLPVTLTTPKIHSKLANKHSNTICMGERNWNTIYRTRQRAKRFSCPFGSPMHLISLSCMGTTLVYAYISNLILPASTTSLQYEMHILYCKQQTLWWSGNEVFY